MAAEAATVLLVDAIDAKANEVEVAACLLGKLRSADAKPCGCAPCRFAVVEPPARDAMPLHDERSSRQLTITETAVTPWDGWLLAWAAMLPLGACAVFAWTADRPSAGLACAAARCWGAALLLFFAGVRRGLSFRTEGGPRPAQLLTFALLFVAGLAAAWLPVAGGLGVVTLAFAVLAVEDPRAALRGEAPLYFARLRPWQMGFAVMASGLCWARA